MRWAVGEVIHVWETSYSITCTNAKPKVKALLNIFVLLQKNLSFTALHAISVYDMAEKEDLKKV